MMVYVVDIVLMGGDQKRIDELKDSLQLQFHTKDLGKLRYSSVLRLLNLRMELVYLRRSMFWIFWRILVCWDRDPWIHLWIPMPNFLLMRGCWSLILTSIIA